MALLAVDEVVKGDVLPYSLGSPRYFPMDNDCVWWFPDLLKHRINDGNNDNNLENETDLAGARSPYSRVTKLHGRTVKSYELDVACGNQGLQTEDYTKFMSI